MKLSIMEKMTGDQPWEGYPIHREATLSKINHMNEVVKSTHEILTFMYVTF